jgi:hypothetical protein
MDQIQLFWPIGNNAFVTAYVPSETYPVAIQNIVGATENPPADATIVKGPIGPCTVPFSLGLADGKRRFVRAALQNAQDAYADLDGQTIGGQEVTSVCVRTNGQRN